MINNGHWYPALAAALCLLAVMIVEERGVSKLSDYSYSGFVFTVFTLHGLVFHLEMRDIYLLSVCVSKASTPVTDRCLFRILNIQPVGGVSLEHLRAWRWQLPVQQQQGAKQLCVWVTVRNECAHGVRQAFKDSKKLVSQPDCCVIRVKPLVFLR